LWFAAFVMQRRVGLSRVWMLFDAGIGVVLGIVLAVDGRLMEGVVVALVVIPILILFSVVRTVQIRYIDRKTQTILDGSPGMREAYERRSIPSRRERKAERDAVE
jgi:hypothetical protein